MSLDFGRGFVDLLGVGMDVRQEEGEEEKRVALRSERGNANDIEIMGFTTSQYRPPDCSALSSMDQYQGIFGVDVSRSVEFVQKEVDASGSLLQDSCL